MPIEHPSAREVLRVRQLGSAIVALVMMLACAALSERIIPAAASQEPPHVPMIVASTTTIPAPEPAPEKQDEPPRVPEQLVMLLAGFVLIGLGGALRAPRHDR
jgi:hypothetical protein